MECRRIVSLGPISKVPVLGTCDTWRLLHNVHQSNRIETAVRCILGSYGSSHMAETSGTLALRPGIYQPAKTNTSFAQEVCFILNR